MSPYMILSTCSKICDVQTFDFNLHLKCIYYIVCNHFLTRLLHICNMGNIILQRQSRRYATAMTFAMATVIALAALGYGDAWAAAGSYVDTITITKQENASVATDRIISGNLDLYYLAISEENAQKVRNAGHDIYNSVGGTTYILLVNPTDDHTAGFNPFALQGARMALNYVVDRDSIISDIIGSGSPLYSGMTHHHPDYTTVHRYLESLGFTYSLQTADDMFTQVLAQAGATKTDGVWHYGGAPIEITVFIRDDDAIRHAIGERIAADLESLGFTVAKRYGDLSDAFSSVYAANPAEQGWHVYTEAWGGTISSRYDTTRLAEYYASWPGFLPGGGDDKYWNHVNEQLDDLTRDLSNEAYESFEQRAEWILQAVQMGVTDAVRIFIAGEDGTFSARSDITGVVNIPGDGIANRYTAINARLPDSDTNLDLGVRHVTQGAWNPVGGFTDSYSATVWSMIRDTAFVRNPHTLDLLDSRNIRIEIDASGLNNPIAIPASAVSWDANADRWISPEQSHAASKITLDLELGSWHHGPPVDINDVLYTLVFREEHHDESYMASKLTGHYLAVNVLDGDTIEVYTDYWHVDEDEIAAAVGMWPVIPWDIHHAMTVEVNAGSAHWVFTTAESRGISWIDMLDTDDSLAIRGHLNDRSDSTHDGSIPTFLYGNKTSHYVSDRYDASISWIDSKGHMVISNGPFYLSGAVDRDEDGTATRIVLEQFDDDTYPFEAGRWASFADFESLTGDVVIGSLAPVSGNAYRYGQEISAASDLAVRDFNRYLEILEEGWRLSTRPLDTQTSPDSALGHLRDLNDMGIKITSGPAIDIITPAMLRYANDNDMLLLSCCSSTPAHAIHDDALYRMLPDQRVHARAIVDTMTSKEENVMHVVMVGIQDSWASEMLEAAKPHFESRGVSTGNVVYYDILEWLNAQAMQSGSASQDEAYDATDDVLHAAASELAAAVTKAVAQSGADNVAVLYVGFGEGPEFLKRAAQHDILRDVRWFGADQNTASPNIADDPAAADFADAVRFVAVQPGLPVANHVSDMINQDIHRRLASQGVVPSPYSSYAYDSIWVLGLSILNAQSLEPADVREQIAPTAMLYVGAVGSTELNENGDLADTRYAAWQLSGTEWMAYETSKMSEPARICR